METQGNNPDVVDRQTKIADRISVINNGITHLNEQHGRISDLIRPMLRARMPEEEKDNIQPLSESPLLVSNEIDCELIVLLDNIAKRLTRLTENNADLIDRIDE